MPSLLHPHPPYSLRMLCLFSQTLKARPLGLPSAWQVMKVVVAEDSDTNTSEQQSSGLVCRQAAQLKQVYKGFV